MAGLRAVLHILQLFVDSRTQLYVDDILIKPSFLQENFFLFLPDLFLQHIDRIWLKSSFHWPGFEQRSSESVYSRLLREDLKRNLIVVRAGRFFLKILNTKGLQCCNVWKSANLL